MTLIAEAEPEVHVNRSEAGEGSQPSVLTGARKEAPVGSLRRNAAWGSAAAGLLMLLGSLIDHGILWVIQFQTSPQWEFVAATNTLEAMPRYGIAMGFLFAALALADVRSLVLMRVMAGGLFLLGLLSLGLGLLLISDYLSLINMAAQNQPAVVTLRQTAIKAGALSAVFVAVLIPASVLVWRRPKKSQP